MAVVLEFDLQTLAEVGRRRVAALRADAVHDEAGFGEAEATVEFRGIEKEQPGFGALLYLDVGFDFVGEVAVDEGERAAVGG